MLTRRILSNHRCGQIREMASSLERVCMAPGKPIGRIKPKRIVVRRSQMNWGPPGGGGGPSSSAVLYGIIGVNGLVFFAWQTNDQRRLRWMADNMVVSLDAIRKGRYHTLVTSFFSHATLPHFAFNMLTLYFFAPAAMLRLGAMGFANLYLAGGVVSSLGTLAYNKIAPKLPIPASYTVNSHSGALGASGAVNSILAYSILAEPRAVIYIYMVLPVPAALAGLGIFCYDLYGAYNGGDHIGHAGHLGGMFLGALWYAFNRI